jgi:hypothetical protein
MKRTLDIINRMKADGIIGRYAIAGAVAAFNYVEATFTEDIDILIPFEAKSTTSLVTLAPILEYLKKLGHTTEFRNEGIMIEGWAVQFLPVRIGDGLDVEALAQAGEIEIESVKVRVLRPEHLVAKALKAGRPKDSIRIIQFVEEGAVDKGALCDVLKRHGLMADWKAFCARTGLADPCKAKGRTKAKPLVGRAKTKRRIKLTPLQAEILARKAEGRRELAKLPIDEKIRRVGQLRERAHPFKEARERRKG